MEQIQTQLMLKAPGVAPSVYLGTLAYTLTGIYAVAAASPEHHVVTIFTDTGGDRREITELLTTIPPNVEVQLITINAEGAKNLAAFLHFHSSQLTFITTAWDEETGQILDQALGNCEEA